MMRGTGAVLVVAVLATLVAQPAFAQRRPITSRDRVEASIGGLWIGGAALGSGEANLRANNVTPTPFRLFTTETNAAAAPGLDARVGYWITRSIAVEAGFVHARPELRTSVSGDAEGVAALDVRERIDQYFIDANVVGRLEQFSFRRMTPFVSGGVGYLRQLHEGRTLVETGRVYQVGGGIRHPFLNDVGWIRTVGLKLHGRVYVLTDGVQLEDRARTHGAISGGVYLTF